MSKRFVLVAGPFKTEKDATETAAYLGSSNHSVFCRYKNDLEGYTTNEAEYFVERDTEAIPDRIFGMNATQIQKIENTFTEIMEKFDFEKVRDLMLINKWTWVDQGPNRESQVPTTGSMRSSCCSMFSRLKEILQAPDHLDHNRMGIGGFQLKFWTWEGGAMELELTFNWESVCYSVARD